MYHVFRPGNPTDRPPPRPPRRRGPRRGRADHHRGDPGPLDPCATEDRARRLRRLLHPGACGPGRCRPRVPVPGPSRNSPTRAARPAEPRRERPPGTRASPSGRPGHISVPHQERRPGPPGVAHSATGLARLHTVQAGTAHHLSEPRAGHTPAAHTRPGGRRPNPRDTLCGDTEHPDGTTAVAGAGNPVVANEARRAPGACPPNLTHMPPTTPTPARHAGSTPHEGRHGDTFLTDAVTGLDLLARTS